MTVIMCSTHFPPNGALSRFADLLQLSPVSSDDQSSQSYPAVGLVGYLELCLHFLGALHVAHLDQLTDGLVDRQAHEALIQILLKCLLETEKLLSVLECCNLCRMLLAVAQELRGHLEFVGSAVDIAGGERVRE
jgi:hypothetical protein